MSTWDVQRDRLEPGSAKLEFANADRRHAIRALFDGTAERDAKLIIRLLEELEHYEPGALELRYTIETIEFRDWDGEPYVINGWEYIEAPISAIVKQGDGSFKLSCSSDLIAEPFKAVFDLRGDEIIFREETLPIE